MFKAYVTNAVISKGFDGAPALKFSEKGNAVRFRIGQKIYDSNAEGNCRWMNFSVKAFGSLCERIEKMKLKEGSFINLSARLDEERWTDKDSGKEKSNHVLILDDIEYAYLPKTDENQKSGQEQDHPAQGTGGNPYMAQDSMGAYMPYGAPAGMPQNPSGYPAQTGTQPESSSGYSGFTGYEAYQGNNVF